MNVYVLYYMVVYEHILLLLRLISPIFLLQSKKEYKIN